MTVENKIKNKIKSPCIGVCSTGIGDDVCRGCKRYAHEIILWNGYSDDEKLAILQRLNSLLCQVVRAKVDVVDEVLLRQQLVQHSIRFDEQGSVYCWVFELLKAGARQISSLREYGCRALPQYRGLSAPELKEVIDEDYYTLSTVHFERYFKPLA